MEWEEKPGRESLHDWERMEERELEGVWLKSAADAWLITYLILHFKKVFNYIIVSKLLKVYLSKVLFKHNIISKV